MTDVVGLEEIDQHARFSGGAKIQVAGICDWLRQLAETTP
jgi:hypothetical protein